MITVQEALGIILQNNYPQTVESVDISQAVGRVLAEDIKADRDFPPFNRVSMDGISISYDAWISGQRDFPIQEIQAAGEPVVTLKKAAHCIEVMTGAMLPTGTDTVIRYEDLSITNGSAHVEIDMVNKGQNIHKQGQDARKNQILVSAGSVISPAEIALLATVGSKNIKVYSFPKAAVVASGSELIPVDNTPEPHQIRRSNTYALQAAMTKLGWHSEQFHYADDKDVLTTALSKLLNDFDVIILSGGVSKGKFDFIPQVLNEIGVKQLFHQVSQRPGKPFWFGVSDKGKVVFALPGNPVSTFMCFYKYIKPWLLKSLGSGEIPSQAILAEDFSFESKLTFFLQVEVRNEGGRLVAYPKAGGGSGDFANLKDVNGFLELPLEKSVFRAGEAYTFIPFR